MEVELEAVWGDFLSASDMQRMRFSQLEELDASIKMDYHETYAFDLPESLQELREDLEVVVHLEAGDLLYVPGGTPHSVLNLEPVFAVAMNYVDVTRRDHVAGKLEDLARKHDLDEAVRSQAERRAHALRNLGRDPPWSTVRLVCGVGLAAVGLIGTMHLLPVMRHRADKRPGGASLAERKQKRS